MPNVDSVGCRIWFEVGGFLRPFDESAPVPWCTRWIFVCCLPRFGDFYLLLPHTEFVGGPISIATCDCLAVRRGGVVMRYCDDVLLLSLSGKLWVLVEFDF